MCVRGCVRACVRACVCVCVCVCVQARGRSSDFGATIVDWNDVCVLGREGYSRSRVCTWQVLFALALLQSLARARARGEPPFPVPQGVLVLGVRLA